MKKGFMFSIEALLCIIAVGALLAGSAYYVTAKEAPADAKLVGAQSSQMSAFYFDEAEAPATGENSYCRKIAQYDYYLETITTKEICR